MFLFSSLYKKDRAKYLPSLPRRSVLKKGEVVFRLLMIQAPVLMDQEHLLRMIAERAELQQDLRDFEKLVAEGVPSGWGRG